MQNLNAEELVSMIKDVTNFEHRVLYFGPKSEDELVAALNDYHNMPEAMKAIPAGKESVEQ